jgi:hypothetical protein
LPSSPAPLIGRDEIGKSKTEVQVHQFDLKSSALLAVSLCLMMVAVVTAPVCVFAVGGQYPPSPGFITTLVAGEKAPVPKLEHSSLLEAETTNIQVAKRVMSDPHLFVFEVVFFDNSLLQRGPDNCGFTMSADYESPNDLVQYLEVGRWRHFYRVPEDSAQLGQAPFLPPYSCYGNAPAVPYVAPPAPEPESKHPPIEGWTVDLQQLWNVAKSHQTLFANGLERCTITTVARLEAVDSRPNCGQWTVFNPPVLWNGVRSSKPGKRLVKEQEQRAVIELVERGVATSQPGVSTKNKSCEKGHYLIIDAHSGAEVDSGTYFLCASPVA